MTWRRVGMLLVAVAALGSCRAASQSELAARFDATPATAFEAALADFQRLQPLDLDGQMAILRVVAPEAERLCYGAPLETMLDIAIPAAQKTGRWAELGELYTMRSAMARVLLGDSAFAGGGRLRAGFGRVAHFAQLAEDALAKAGRSPVTPPAPTRGPKAGEHPHPGAAALERSHPKLAELAHRTDGPGARYSALMDRLTEQVTNAEDAAAVTTLGQILDQVKSEQRGPDEPRAMQAAMVTSMAARLLWLRGADQLLPRLRVLAAERRDLFRKLHPLDNLATGCGLAWTGRDDAFRDAFYQTFTTVEQLGGQPDEGFVLLSGKLRAFGRTEEADALLKRWLELTRRADLAGRPAAFAGNVTDLLVPDLPADQREALLTLACRSWAAQTEKEAALNLLLQRLHRPESLWPMPRRGDYLGDAGTALLSAAARFEKPEYQARAAAEAATMLERGGKAALATQARGFAATFAAGDRSVQLQVALLEGRDLLARGDYAGAEEKLQPFAALTTLQMREFADRGVSQISGLSLLTRAKKGLAKPAEAENVVSQLAQLVETLHMPAARQVKEYLNLSELTSDPTRRLAYLDSARRAAQAAGLTFLAQPLAEKTVKASLATANTQVAKTALLDLIRQDDAQRDRLACDPELRQSWFSGRLWAYQKLLEVCAATDDAATALWCGEQMRGRALLDELSWRKLDLANALPDAERQQFDKLRDEREACWKEIRRLTGTSATDSDDGRFVLVPVRGGDSSTSSDPEIDRLQARLDALTRQEAALESAVREAVPAYRQASNVKPLSAQELLALLPPNTALLEYTLTEQGVVGVAVSTGRRATVKALAPQADELAEAAGDLRALLIGRSDAYDAEAERWYNWLVAPFESSLAGAKRLLVVGDGALQLIPFAALRSADGRYLTERYAVATAPSLRLAGSQREASSPPPATALVVADPTLRGLRADDDTRFVLVPTRGEGVSDHLLTMAHLALPGARSEGRAVAAQLPGATLLLGNAATKARFLEAAPAAGVLHIATHGYADPDAPDFSGLLLSDGGKQPFAVLTAEEVYLLKLNAKLVTLSACETGLGKTVQGEGLLGLTRAFLYAGARDVVCSLWQVADDSTAVLMRRMYANLAGSGDPATALQAAQQALLTQPATRHPFYWSGFVVVQGPR